MKEADTREKICFEDAYGLLHLSTVHRHFNGTDASLIAVFCLLELLHNFKDLVSLANKDKAAEYAKDWYRKCLEGIESGHFYISARPVVYEYVFKNKGLSEKKKNKILDDARDELLLTLRITGIKDFIEKTLETIQEHEHETNATPTNE